MTSEFGPVIVTERDRAPPQRRDLPGSGQQLYGQQLSLSLSVNAAVETDSSIANTISIVLIMCHPVEMLHGGHVQVT
ncbi:hypothetical protein J6590_008097 [Homalodisca vitripennis]|nr:hypothetical protein J6590_008097 [Homalodisca vitripennis]